jgi:hypothetical protein
VVEFEIGAVHVGLDPQNPLTLDLPRSALASLEVEVLVNRKPAGHVMLRLQDDDGGNTDDRMTNVHGVYRFPIVSGKSKDLYVWPVGSWWALRVQEALEVKGAATKHRVDIAVGRRRFRVLTPEGLPVARREVEIAGAFGKDAYFGKSRRFETDDSGFVTLEVPSVPGMVSVCFHEMRASVEIDRPSSKDLDVKLTN